METRPRLLCRTEKLLDLKSTSSFPPGQSISAASVMSGEGPVSLAPAPLNFDNIRNTFEQVSKSLPTTPVSDRSRTSKSPSPPKVSYGTKPRKDMNEECTSRTPDPPRRSTPTFKAELSPTYNTEDRMMDFDAARALLRERSSSPSCDRLSPPAMSSDDTSLDVPVESKHLSHLTKRRLTLPSNALKRRPTPNFLRKNGILDSKFSTTPVALSQ